MTPSILPDHLHATETHKDIHVCLLDDAGQVCASNYPLGNKRAVPLPDLVRLPYGVDPHADMPDIIYQRMEARLESSAGSAGFYMCQSPDSDVPLWLSVNIYNTPNGRIVSHFPVSSPRFEQYATFFAQLKSQENPDGDTQKLAAEQINEGMQDYRAIAVHIMVEELFKRDSGRNRPQYKSFEGLHAILKTLYRIDDYGKRIDAMSARSKLIPYQLKLQASRLEGGSGPLSVIATNHQELTETLLSVTSALQSASTSKIDAVMDAMTYLSQSNQVAELLEQDQVTCCEADTGGQKLRDELVSVIEDCSLQFTTLLAKIDTSIAKLGRICHSMRRSLSAMETTRMMCKIERSRLTEEAEGLIGTEEQLHDVHVNLLKWMEKIESSATEALILAEDLKQVRANRAA